MITSNLNEDALDEDVKNQTDAYMKEENLTQSHHGWAEGGSQEVQRLHLGHSRE